MGEGEVVEGGKGVGVSEVSSRSCCVLAGYWPRAQGAGFESPARARPAVGAGQGSDPRASQAALSTDNHDPPRIRLLSSNHTYLPTMDFSQFNAAEQAHM